MKLIVDAGGTSCAWALLNHGSVIAQTSTDAIHALLTPDNDITVIANKAANSLGDPQVEELYFYGAGCASESINNRLLGILSQTFEKAKIQIASDMLCAARALFGRKPGIACIIGTGSNSCLYNGEEITANTPPLGFILGDEGSGAVLGRNLISDILKHQLPEEIEISFFKKYSITKEDIIENVYRKPSPNRFLASFTPFLHEHLDSPEIDALVTESFKSFLSRNVLQYDNSHALPISFIGSVAFHFSTQLRKALEAYSLKLGDIKQSPLSGIIAFHL